MVRVIALDRETLTCVDAACLFCDLIAGDGFAEWIWRGDTASALAPPGSNWPGHTLVISNEHAIGVQDAPSDAMQAVVTLVQHISRRMTDVFGATGVNILNASGLGSGQSVDHLHFHVVPRWADDGMNLWPRGQQSSYELDDRWTEHLRMSLVR